MVEFELNVAASPELANKSSIGDYLAAGNKVARAEAICFTDGSSF